ncbi:MAG: LptF/LptG family permease [Candidatus Omnitrophica bacterium]|nr:LptF/LptG family permease [Candidatus Omnitrophota bacterium]
MRILDRYILKSCLGIFFGCLFIFLFLYVIIDIFANLDQILKQKVAIEMLLQYYLSYLPIIFVQVSPIACLLSTLYTFAKLNRGNEIIAMRSAGLSIFQITKTVLLFGALISLFVFLANDKIVPPAMATNQRIKDQMDNNTKKQNEKKNEIITNLSMYGLKNRLFFVNKFTVATNTMEGITILEHDEHQNITKKVVANKGIYKDNHWLFYQSITYNFDISGQVLQEPEYYDEEIMTIPESPADFINQRQRVDFMTIAQIENYIWRLSKSGATTVIRNLKIDLYQRYTSPFTSLIIMLLGIPFALMMKKRATGVSSLGFSIMVGFLYYVINAVSIAFGKGGILMPILSASLSHIIAIIFSLYLIFKLP